MGKLFLNYLSSTQIYICATCNSHLAERDDIVSKQFQGATGPAFLFRDVVNVCSGVVEKRNLRTGAHEVADIFCKTCQELVGWKYEVAYEEDQKYKEGKFILEIAKIKRAPSWIHTHST